MPERKTGQTSSSKRVMKPFISSRSMTNLRSTSDILERETEELIVRDQNVFIPVRNKTESNGRPDGPDQLRFPRKYLFRESGERGGEETTTRDDVKKEHEKKPNKCDCLRQGKARRHAFG